MKVNRNGAIPPGYWMYIHRSEEKVCVEDLHPHEKVWYSRDVDVVSLTSDVTNCDFCGKKFKEGEDVFALWVVER